MSTGHPSRARPGLRCSSGRGCLRPPDLGKRAGRLDGLVADPPPRLLLGSVLQVLSLLRVNLLDLLYERVERFEVAAQDLVRADQQPRLGSCPRDLLETFLDAGKFRSTGAEQAGKVVELRSHLAEIEHRRDQALRRRPLTQRPPQPVREIRRVLRPNVDAEVLQAIGLLAEQVDPHSPFLRTWKVSQRLFTARRASAKRSGCPRPSASCRTRP